jgi:hypothetical protein
VTHRLISSILKHDRKQNSYKIALLRALNDIVLAFPGVRRQGRDVAVPLTALAEFWVAYYWPFVDPEAPILQGVRALRSDELRSDLSFRAHLTELRRSWQAHHGSSSAADGFHLINEMRVERRRKTYSPTFLKLYRGTLVRIAQAIRQPVQYAGPGQWQVFEQPRRLSELPQDIATIPGASARDLCIVVRADLWAAFHDVSLWVEALCIHEWSLFSERIGDYASERGRIYRLLTENPGNRLPLDWERNEINLLIIEGTEFRCPWTDRRLDVNDYQLDHVIPVSVYPFNELWNLVPADMRFNMHVKRDRIPGPQALLEATPRLASVYGNYSLRPPLGQALASDVAARFSANGSPEHVARSVGDLVQQISEARNLPTF